MRPSLARLSALSALFALPLPGAWSGSALASPEVVAQEGGVAGLERGRVGAEVDFIHLTHLRRGRRDPITCVGDSLH